jgi:hypothetical protein
VACAYVLSLGYPLESTQSERNCDEKQWDLVQADLTITAATGNDNFEGCSDDIKSDVTDPPIPDSADGSQLPDRNESTLVLGGAHADAVQRVLDLHTTRRMKPLSANYGVKPGSSAGFIMVFTSPQCRPDSLGVSRLSLCERQADGTPYPDQDGEGFAGTT